MPILILCGPPCSQKSLRSREFLNYLFFTYNLENVSIVGESSLPPLPSDHKYFIDPFQAFNYNKAFPDKLSPPFDTVVIINHESLGQRRVSSFNDPTTEKNTRSSIRSAVERFLNKNTLVIMDSIGSLRSFRFELFCHARTVRSQISFLHCQIPESVCKERNLQRLAICKYRYAKNQFLKNQHNSSFSGSEPILEDFANQFQIPLSSLKSNTSLNFSHIDAYPPPVLEDLLARYEQPYPDNWWDRPLFVVDDWISHESALNSICEVSGPLLSSAELSIPVSTSFQSSNIDDFHRQTNLDSKKVIRPQHHVLSRNLPSFGQICPWNLICETLFEWEPPTLNLATTKLNRAPPNFVFQLNEAVKQVISEISSLIDVGKRKFYISVDSKGKIISSPFTENDANSSSSKDFIIDSSDSSSVIKGKKYLFQIPPSLSISDIRRLGSFFVSMTEKRFSLCLAKVSDKHQARFLQFLSKSFHN